MELLSVARCLIGTLALFCVGTMTAQTHIIYSTSGSDLSGSFTFGGSLASDGTFDFDSAGNPLSGTSIEVTYLVSTSYSLSSSGSLAGTFSMDGDISNGTHDFNSSGEPLSSPSFTWTGGSSTGLPNQNDDYTVSGGVVTSMKYDVGSGLRLALDGTYEIGVMPVTESGTYTISAGSTSYETSSAFTDQPNENDDYVVSSGVLSALKYDVGSVGGLSLNLNADGTFSLKDGGIEVGSGTYAVAAVPEPASWALIIGFLSISGALYRRRRLLGGRH